MDTNTTCEIWLFWFLLNENEIAGTNQHDNHFYVPRVSYRRKWTQFFNEASSYSQTKYEATNFVPLLNFPEKTCFTCGYDVIKADDIAT